MTMRDDLIDRVNERKRELLVITKRPGFRWGAAIRHVRGLPWRPLPALDLGKRTSWVLGRNGVIYVAAPDASLYVSVNLAGMSEHRLRGLLEALESTLIRYTGVG